MSGLLSVAAMCRLCKGAVAGLCILMALVWSMLGTYSSAVDHPATYLTSALLPIFICMLSAYFVAELWDQVIVVQQACIQLLE